MPDFARTAVSPVVQQHLEDAVALRATRSALIAAPHVKLHQLARLDDRLAAALDGLALAGDAGRRACLASLESPTRGAVFAATVGAIEQRDTAALDRLLAIAEADAAARSGLVSALGWVPARSLRGMTRPLLDSASAAVRSAGLSACGAHQVDPGALLASGIEHPETARHAARCAAALGRVDLLPALLMAMARGDAADQVACAASALLLGDRDRSVQVLLALAEGSGPHQAVSASVLLRIVEAEPAGRLLRSWSSEPGSQRMLIRGIGARGDPHYVPWLIKQMDDLQSTRLAGEAFSTITGVDLALFDMERKPPDGQESGPNDDTADTDVSMDEDDGLPWPDPGRIAAWWQAHGTRFAGGTRYFMGEPPSTAHCLSVLRTGFQRQRAAAAQHLCLLNPGTPLFNVAAPAWRQQRLLASMPA